MNQITLETSSSVDLRLLLSLAKRLNIKVVQLETLNDDITDTPLEQEEILTLLDNSASFDFLNAEDEDIYTDKDLKITY